MNITGNVYDYYKLKKCLDPKRIYWWNLVLRNNAIPFMEKHINILNAECLKKLSRNPLRLIC